MYVWPRNVFQDGGKSTKAYYHQMFGDSFDPVTGAGGDTEVPSDFAGPLSTFAGKVTNYYENTTTVKIDSIMSDLNNKGTIELVYWD